MGWFLGWFCLWLFEFEQFCVAFPYTNGPQIQTCLKGFLNHKLLLLNPRVSNLIGWSGSQEFVFPTKFPGITKASIWDRLCKPLQCTHLPICFPLVGREVEGLQRNASWPNGLPSSDDTGGIVCVHRNGSRKGGRKKHTFGASSQYSLFHYSMKKEMSLEFAD